MRSHYLFEALQQYGPYKEVHAALGTGVISAYGMSDAQKAHLVCALAEETGRQVLYLCESEKRATRVLEDLSALTDGSVSLFPAREISFYQDVAASREVANRRIETLSRLTRGEVRAVVAPADTLLHRVMPRSLFAENTLRLSVGDRVDPTLVAEQLVASGYSREYMVEGKGQFSVRGGIIDVFATDASQAFRIDFFDDEVDSIRTFSVMDQRSQENLSQIQIAPASEALVQEEAISGVARILKEAAGRHRTVLGGNVAGGLSDLPMEDEEDGRTGEYVDENGVPFSMVNRGAERFVENLQKAVEQMQAGIGTRLLEKYLNLLWDSSESILDYMNRPLVVVDEPIAIRERMESRRGEFVHAFSGAMERGEAIKEQETLLYTLDDVLRMLIQRGMIALSTIRREYPELRVQTEVDLGGQPLGSYSGRIRDMCRDVQNWMMAGWRVAVLAGGKARGERMCQSFGDEGIEASFDEHCMQAPKGGKCTIYPASLSQGFTYPQLRLAVIVESDVYGKKAQRARKQKNEAGRLNSFTDLAVGDYVVHETHGIGIYQGIKRLFSDGVSRDYLQIQYLGGDKLYIPVDHFDRIQKYIGAGESAAPKLSDLGGKNWKKQKAKVRESLKALAFDLVALYAQRQKNKGHAFSPDTPWQQEFEENFPYEETPDQLIAVEEIKADMEKELPMDRLLCGDVGYGKTEVALRAAFKAIMDGYQVAILAPTTILVQQHYQTILRRFEGFPVKADYLSRFKTAAQQGETIRALADGSIDLIVATHRLLNKTVQFKKLGLLIIDEEQRFGVGHKETIKNMKQSVDVLTLSATPIPRTLHMSMVGIRDMSLLETPPQARYPVQTYVMEYQDSVIRDAILRELGRNGQVFFLYNKVESIDQCYRQLQQLVPEARIAIAHGQMKENVLEDVMLDFSQQKYDVLLCTTIIESGLDIPSVNTLIVYDADHFGLGQLYQIRGRVGRSNRLAYAYLTVRPNKMMTENAQKRLDTIREFTEFGSGFKIAMRDLELRGAGNILGPQQSGHLADIGYDLYCKLLDEAVKEAQGQPQEANREIETRMDVHINAYLPQEYVSGDKQRLEVYKRIAGITTAAERDDVEEELVDRFGDEPVCVANLVSVAYLKAMCSRFGMERVVQQDGAISMFFSPDAVLDGVALFKAISAVDGRLSLQNGNRTSLVLRDKTKGREEMLNLTVRIMERLTERLFPQKAEKDA